MLEDALEPRSLPAAGGVGFVTPIALGVIDLSPSRLLGIESEFSVRLAALDIAGDAASERQNCQQNSDESFGTNDGIPFHALRFSPDGTTLPNRFTMIVQRQPQQNGLPYRVSEG